MTFRGAESGGGEAVVIESRGPEAERLHYPFFSEQFFKVGNCPKHFL